VALGEQALIHRSNWITGLPVGNARHFRHRTDRDPALVLGAHAAITKSHHVDCCDRVEIGAFATVGGYGSQLLTHAIDLARNRQDAAPITIGEYCFVGTDVVILGGAKLPARSVLGAKALLNKAHTEAGWLYAGVPAVAVRRVADDAGYFTRATGFVE
jgi:acetyltransferase-like isoleucine patch superfamily enzyme